MESLIPAILVFACFLVLLGIRNEIVYKTRMKAIAIIFSYKDWQKQMAVLENPGYYTMVFDLTKWTFKGFYPEQYARELENTGTQQEK